MTRFLLSRRGLLAASATLALPARALAQDRPSAPAGAPGGATLVAWFSRSGNTAVIAGQIRRATGAEPFEIVPARSYPEDYEETVAQSRQERDSGFEPELAATVAQIGRYETVYLGFPIWSGTVPPVIRSFLSRHDLAGKRLVPFMTHGGFGVGDSGAVLARLAPDSRIAEPFQMEADQERRTLDRVTGWLGAAATP